MTSHHTPQRRPARGVSLIELMIGMAIGLLAVLVMTQVTVVFEGRKRSTTSGSDAQVNGALALQTLQRDIQMAGYGMTSGGPWATDNINYGSAVGCQLSGVINGAAANLPNRLVPVQITDGALTDELYILSAGKTSTPIPIALSSNHAPSDTFFTMRKGVNTGNFQGDLMLAVSADSASTCTLFTANVNNMIPELADGSDGVRLTTVVNGSPLVEVAAASDPASAVAVGRRLGHTADASTSGIWNGNGVTPLISSTYTATHSYLVNLGRPADFISRGYRITPQGLGTSTFNGQTGVTTNDSEALYPNIIQLQAVYGKAKLNTAQRIDTWEASDPAADVIAGGASGWTRVFAIHVAIVARSSQYEGKPGDLTFPTNTEPSWKPDGVTSTPLKIPSLVTCPTSEVNCWKHYRYRVFETVIPLRNMIWQPIWKPS